MANMSIKEHDGSDQDTLAPLPQPNNWAGNVPPQYSAGWRPPYQMPQAFPDLHPYNPAAFTAPTHAAGVKVWSYCVWGQHGQLARTSSHNASLPEHRSEPQIFVWNP